MSGQSWCRQPTLAISRLLTVLPTLSACLFLQRHIHTKYEDEEAPDDVVGGGGPMDQGDEMVDEAVEEEESEEEMFMAEGGGSGAGGGDADDHDASMMESKVDPVAWKMELERVCLINADRLEPQP